MKIKKTSGTRDAQIFQARLDELPGWNTLSATKQGELYEHTTRIHSYDQMERMGKFGKLVELVNVHLLLEGEEMRMEPYVARIYPTDHARTIKRKVQDLGEISARIPKPILEEISSVGQDVLSKYDHLLSVALGDIRNAVNEMPLLPVSTEKRAEEFLEELDGKVQEERKNRPIVAKLRKMKDFAEQAGANAVIQHMRTAELKTSAQKRQFLQRVGGWAMDAEAVSGMVRLHRIPRPEGVGRHVGRPRRGSK